MQGLEQEERRLGVYSFAAKMKVQSAEDETSRNAIIDSNGAGWPSPVCEGLVSAWTQDGKRSPSHFWAFRLSCAFPAHARSSTCAL